MKDERKTKNQLIAEMEEMRQQRAVERASERIREEVLAMRSTDDFVNVAADERSQFLSTFAREYALSQDESYAYGNSD